MHRVEAPVDLDALLTAVRDYFQRALEELLIKGPLANPRDNPEYHEVCCVWVWFGGGGGTKKGTN